MFITRQKDGFSLDNQSGFTLIELAAVALIILLLMYAAYKSYQTYTYKEKVKQTVQLGIDFTRAMHAWKMQEQAEDFQAWTALTNDATRKQAFSNYAFSLEDNRNPWGKQPSTGNFYPITLTTNSGCNGLIAGHDCAELQISTPTANAADQIRDLFNEQLINFTTGGNPAAANIVNTDPMTNEPIYVDGWAYTTGTAVVYIEVP